MIKHDKEAIQIMIDFVEGKISAQDFKNQFNNNVMIKQTLNNDPNRSYTITYGYDLIPYIEAINVNTICGANSMHEIIQFFLERNNYSYTPTKKYEKDYVFLLKIQPSWLDINDEKFLNSEIINKIPVELKTETKKIKWCKEKIKELFRYDNRPPRWIQDPEWPIMNGKPLVYKGQSKEIKDDERVQFYFYDPDTKEEVIVEQFY